MKHAIILLTLSVYFLWSCTGDNEECTALGANMTHYCSTKKIIAKNRRNCLTDIKFKVYINRYSFTRIESSYRFIGEPCNNYIFFLKYINSVHDHNEPDITFILNLKNTSADNFFKKDTFQIESLRFGSENISGGLEGDLNDADITLVWDTVSLYEGIYSGSGKLIINKAIPHIAKDYIPAQTIAFNFCNWRR